MSLLALDLGTTTGWALGDSKVEASGTASFKTDRYSGGGMRYLRFRRWLTELHSISPVTEVRFEEVRRHRGTDAAHVYGGLLATLTAWCEEHAIPYAGIPVQTIKIHATGKGNASKELMIEAAQKLGFKPEDENHADAICTFMCAMSDIKK